MKTVKKMICESAAKVIKDIQSMSWNPDLDQKFREDTFEIHALAKTDEERNLVCKYFGLVRHLLMSSGVLIDKGFLAAWVKDNGLDCAKETMRESFTLLGYITMIQAFHDKYKVKEDMTELIGIDPDAIELTKVKLQELGLIDADHQYSDESMEKIFESFQKE